MPELALPEILLDSDNVSEALAHPLVRGLIEHAATGIIVIDAERQHILAASRRAKELLGYCSEINGHSCRATVNSPNCSQHCLLNAAFDGDAEGSVAEVLYRGRDKQGEVHARTRAVPVRGAGGKVLAGIEFIDDLTEVRSMEKQLGQRRSLHGIVGVSDAMQTLYDLLEQVAPYDLPVLITGESGVGKERFASAVQFLSDRADKAYVRVNCAAINPSLIESELFGHRRGAFTGASQDRGGRFEEAHRGTILLDEVGELPLHLQPKLLRVLQTGEIERVGEDRARTVDVRVLAATNRDIEREVAEGRFREDLYYRLAGVRLHVPPLRERAMDVLALVEHFLERFSEEAQGRGRPKTVRGLSRQAMDNLVSRPWRGNVRELENVLRLAFIRAPRDRLIELEHLTMPGSQVPQLAESMSLADLEARAIRQAMAHSGGNMTAAARVLGIDRSTLWRKLRKDA